MRYLIIDYAMTRQLLRDTKTEQLNGCLVRCCEEDVPLLTSSGHEYLNGDGLQEITASKYRPDLIKVPFAVEVVDVLVFGLRVGGGVVITAVGFG